MDAHPLADFTARVERWHGADREQAPLAVVTAQPMLEQEHPALGHRRFPGINGRLRIVWMHRVRPAVPLVLCLGLPGERRPTRLFAGHPAQRIVGPEDALHRVHRRAKAITTFFQESFGAASLGKVEHGPDHTDGLAVFVPDHIAPVEDVYVRAISREEPVLLGPGRAVAIDQGMNAVRHPLPVVRMDMCDPPVAVWSDLLGGIAEQVAHRFVPQHLVGQQVPVPDGVSGGARRETVAFGRFAKFRIAFPLFGDVARLDDRTDRRACWIEHWTGGEGHGVKAAVACDEQLLTLHLRPFGKCPIDGALVQGIVRAIRLLVMHNIVQRTALHLGETIARQ